MRRKEENLTLSMDLAGDIFPECAQAFIGKGGDFTVSFYLDLNSKQRMN